MTDYTKIDPDLLARLPEPEDTPPVDVTPKCAYCGTEGDYSYHSGVRECPSCWDYRKLDGPAARHWATMSEGFLSNVDFYDLMKYFPKCGLSSDEAYVMLKAARKVKLMSEYLVKHGPVERWDKGTKTAYDVELDHLINF